MAHSQNLRSAVVTETAQVCDKPCESGPAQTGQTCFNPAELLGSFSSLIGNQRTNLGDDFGIVSGANGYASGFEVESLQRKNSTSSQKDLSFLNGFEVQDFTPESEYKPDKEDQKMFDVISQKLRQSASENRFSGQLVISKDGIPIFKYTDGIGDTTNNTPLNDETKMRIGSMGKMFTALAIMQLYQGCKLSLDNTLADFNTGFPDKELAAKISIRQLLTHQAGVGDSLNEKFDANRDNLHNIDDFIRLFESGERNPQDVFKYSNYGYMLLGKIVESVTGQSFASYVQENIFNRAMMTHSSMNEAPDTNSARAYLNIDGKLVDVTARHPLSPTPAGGAFSTAGDLGRFMEAFRSGKLLRPDLVNLMTSAKIVSDAETGDRYGYGMELADANGVRTYGHAGGFEGTAANARVFPDSGYSYTIISNISESPEIQAELFPYIDKVVAERIKRN